MHLGVVAFGIFGGQISGQYVVPRRGEAVAAHATVVRFFVGSLPKRGQAHNHVARLNVVVRNHVGAFHATNDGAVHGNGPH